MCFSKPSVPAPTEYQQEKSPVYAGGEKVSSKSGRRGTILTGGEGVMPSSPTGKKTLLGQ